MSWAGCLFYTKRDKKAFPLTLSLKFVYLEQICSLPDFRLEDSNFQGNSQNVRPCFERGRGPIPIVLKREKSRPWMEWIPGNCQSCRFHFVSLIVNANSLKARFSVLQLDVNCAHDGCSLKILHILWFLWVHCTIKLAWAQLETTVILHVQKKIRAERAIILGTCRKCFVRAALVWA